VAIAAAGYWALEGLHPLLALVWNVFILYLLVGFRHFSHAFSAIAETLKAGDVIAARRRLAAWCGIDASAATAGEIPKLAIEQGLTESYRHVFGTLFWFLVLPGPVGAVLYRLTVLLTERWRGDAVTPMGHELGQFGQPVARLLFWLDWAPVRLTAVTFAIVGDFEDAIYCWRTQAKAWPSLHDGILLASGAGALGALIGARLSDTLVSHLLPYAIGYRPNPGLSSTPLYVLEAGFIAWVFKAALTADPHHAEIGFAGGVMAFVLVLPLLWLLRTAVPALRRVPWTRGQPMPAWASADP